MQGAGEPTRRKGRAASQYLVRWPHSATRARELCCGAQAGARTRRALWSKEAQRPTSRTSCTQNPKKTKNMMAW